MVALLQQKGWRIHHYNGSHCILKHSNGKTVTVPIHGHRDLKQGTQMAITRHTGLSRQDIENA